MDPMWSETCWSNF